MSTVEAALAYCSLDEARGGQGGAVSERRCVNARDLDGAVARLDGAPAELLADVEVRALEAVVELRHEPAGVAALPLDRDQRP